MKRRRFIQLSTAAIGSALIPSRAAAEAAQRPALVELQPLAKLPHDQTRTWLGPDYWANRLQDWRLRRGRIECVQGKQSFEVRTVSLLTRSLLPGHTAGRLQVKTGCLEPGKPGFCGFLLGVGAGQLDYRGSALAQRFAGKSGGFMAVLDSRGELSFRDFSNQDKPLGFESLARSTQAKVGSIGSREVLLDCHLDPVAAGKFDIRLVATDADSKEELGFAVRTGVLAGELLGGIALLSSPAPNAPGARWWFSGVASGGDKIGCHPQRALGPVIGCLHSLNRKILKLTAQFMPISLVTHDKARLDYRVKGSNRWTRGPTAAIEEGFVALFRLDNWDPGTDHDYRILYADDKRQTLYSGQIAKDPGTDKALNIALYSCIIPTANSLDLPDDRTLLPEENVLGRYQPEHIFFPHRQLVAHCDSHQPDLYVFCGDQYYETYPTRSGRNTADAKLDTLYRWYLWYWTFGESVRNRPSIILADDHDVLQGNLWGDGGKNSDKPTEEEGGFKWDKDLVRMVYRMQHGHNPDAYDPTPIAFDIPVTYGSFVYGGVSFALVEDRKFKSPPDYESKPELTHGELLGKRQEDFLKAWQDMDSGLPKVCIAASMWGSPQTKGNLEPLLDYDANGYPPDGRTRAVKLVSAAGALVLAGDQHLGMLAMQGIDEFDDGALFFAGPAAAAFWQRWFEGEGKLRNQRNQDPNTGDFVDTFGNKMRVLAVANPKISYLDFTAGNKSRGMFLSDRRLKSEGYGIIKVDHRKKHYRLECWPWDADPEVDKQFPGWPYVHKFSLGGN